MFKAIYDKLFFTRADNAYWCVMLPTVLMFTAFMVVGGIVTLGEGNDVDTFPTITVIFWYIFLFAIPFWLIPLYDSIIEWVVEVVTDGDIKCSYFIGTFLFGNNYADSHRGCIPNNTFDRVVVITGFFVLPMQLVGLVVAFPVLLPYALVIGSIVGMAAGAIFGARKMYRISKQLKQHAADPNAHKTNGEQK